MTSPGLTSAEAATRLQRDGLNELPTPKGPHLVTRFGRELVHFFAIMLWLAGILAFVADLAELGVAIFAVVIVNAVFSFAEERKSDHAADRLKALLPRRVTVRRDGLAVELDASEVVVGDLLMLDAGDRICADATVEVSRGLRVDTSMITGESEALGVEVTQEVSAGTFVVDGEGEARVTATASSTRLAQIAHLATMTKRPRRPLTKELDRVARRISLIAVTVGLAFLVVSLALGSSMADAAVLSIGVTVALVPEGLLPTVTLSLAIGAQRMARKNALVRHLDAVETLGSTTFICTDKTGTLTQNRMVVTDLWTPAAAMAIDGEGYGPEADLTLLHGDRRNVEALARAGGRCSTGRAVERDGGWVAMGDPMEAAIDACARRLGIDLDLDRREHRELDRFPFDASRRRMSTVIELPAGSDRSAEVLVKGAAEGVLELCDGDPVVTACREAALVMARRGLRVLAVGRRALNEHLPGGGVELAAGATAVERDLEIVGLIGLLDPPRTTARGAVERCRRAGIKVLMITGDHPDTAAAIATQVGLAVDGAPAFTGSDLPAAPGALGAMIDHDGVVVSRATPEVKLRIAEALRARGHIVAMTGDGVNDGPALRAANIGVAMGRSGTDVAREAADIVLLDDDFATIVEAVALGRATFLNVRRFLTYHLTDNVAELTPFLVWALSGGRVPLALTVMQVLALDIGTDTTSATALGAEPPSVHVLDGPPVSGRLLNRTVAVRAFLLLGPTEALVSMAAFLATFAVAGWRPGDSFPEGPTLLAASGAAFLAVVLGQKANAWACRSTTVTPWRLGWFGNRLLIVTALCEMVFAILCLTVPPVAHALENNFPSAAGMVVAASSVPAVLAVDALYKRRRVRPVWDPRPVRQM